MVALLSYWKLKRRPTKPIIEIGGVTLEAKPLSLENALRLTLLLAPHVARIDRQWPKLQQAIGDGALLEALLKDLAKEMQFAPGDIVTAYSLLLDMPPEWVAVNATAKELVEALPILDEINDFRGLLGTAYTLGLIDG